MRFHFKIAGDGTAESFKHHKKAIAMCSRSCLCVERAMRGYRSGEYLYARVSWTHYETRFSEE